MSSSFLTTRGKRQPTLPELQNITNQQWTDVYLAGVELAASAIGKEDAHDAVHDAYIALSTTNRYHPEKGPFERHFLNLVLIQCRNYRTHAIRELEALEGLHQDNAPSIEHEQEELSPHAMTLAIAAEEDDDLWRHRTRAELRRLRKAVSRNRVAVALLEHWALHGGDRPLSKIAESIGCSHREVYDAKKHIEEAALRILSKKEEGDDS